MHKELDDECAKFWRHPSYNNSHPHYCLAVYHQWLLTKVMDLLRQMADKLPGTGKTGTKKEDMNNNRKDSDFQLKR